jgi:hypothetical protein
MCSWPATACPGAGPGASASWCWRPASAWATTSWPPGPPGSTMRQRCDTLWYFWRSRSTRRGATTWRAPMPRSPCPSWPPSCCSAWPPLTPDMHLLDFDGGRVRLLLAWGDIAQVLPDLVASADAFYLDGFAPDRNPAMWDPWRLRQLPRLAAPGATVATWSAASAVRQGLQAPASTVQAAAGLGRKREMTPACHAPRFTPPAAAGPPCRWPHPCRRGRGGCRPGRRGHGGGAGPRGLAVHRVRPPAPAPAQETSGNPAGLFHGTVPVRTDGPHARWLRAAALHGLRVLRRWLARGAVPGAAARPAARRAGAVARGHAGRRCSAGPAARLPARCRRHAASARRRPGWPPRLAAGRLAIPRHWSAPLAAATGITLPLRHGPCSRRCAATEGWRCWARAGNRWPKCRCVVLCKCRRRPLGLAGLPGPVQRRCAARPRCCRAGRGRRCRDARRWPMAAISCTARRPAAVRRHVTADDDDPTVRGRPCQHNLAALRRR